MRLLDDEPDLPAQINIVPMIDAIFAILAFFIMSTLFLTKSEGLPVTLPSATTSQRQESAPATVTIDAQSQLFLNRKPIAAPDLIPALTALKAEDPQLLVILNADETVTHGAVVQVMDQLRQIEGVRLAIATTQP
ncbi:MAG: biopolymer transporter ExbD [Prochlorothrix sp.]|nr:biopolymer transporter ExbD [Prochlorothrix sp.]